MEKNLAPKEAKKAKKLKDLAQVLANYNSIIEAEEHRSHSIQEAIEAVHYYSRLFKNMENE